MSSIVVLWYGGDSKLSRLIQTVTRSTLSHTAIMVDGVLYEALGRGIRRLDGLAARKRAEEAIAHTVLPAHRHDVGQVRAWLESQVGKGYSVIGFILAGIQTITGQSVVVSLPGEYICSGLAARALQLAGYLHDIEARLATPASLALLLGPEDLPYSDVEREAERRRVVEVRRKEHER